MTIATVARAGPLDGEAVLDRESARAFVDEHVGPHANDFERAGRLPEELLERMSDAGLWAPFLPLEYGGSALDLTTLGEIHEEVGRGCSSVRSLLTVHTMLSWALMRWGSGAQRERWGQALARG
ncbi:MAG: acyl-CoA dehydrogenase family protein, partial [Actinobacteria bacterium]|nr:acyl-CoA dehydrogenase family protein [Actinomycetota bacterium]